MIVTGLIGALVKTRYKFGFYVFGCIAMLVVFYELAVTGRKHAKALGADIHRTFLMTGVWTLFIWALYPVAWGLSEGGNVISPDSEAVFYGVLDFCAKPIFSALLIWGHWNIDPARLGLRITDYDSNTHEKHPHNNDYGHPVNGTSGTSTGAVPGDGATHRHGETAAHNAPGTTAV